MEHMLNIPPFPTSVRASGKNLQYVLNLFKLEFDENHTFLVYNVFTEIAYGFQGYKKKKKNTPKI